MKCHSPIAVLVLALLSACFVLAAGCGPGDALEDPDVTVVEQLTHALAGAIAGENEEAYGRILAEGFELSSYHPISLFQGRSFSDYRFSGLALNRLHDLIQVSAMEEFCWSGSGVSAPQNVRRFCHMTWQQDSDGQWRMMTRTPDGLLETDLDLGAPPVGAGPPPLCP